MKGMVQVIQLILGLSVQQAMVVSNHQLTLGPKSFLHRTEVELQEQDIGEDVLLVNPFPTLGDVVHVNLVIGQFPPLLNSSILTLGRPQVIRTRGLVKLSGLLQLLLDFASDGVKGVMNTSKGHNHLLIPGQVLIVGPT